MSFIKWSFFLYNLQECEGKGGEDYRSTECRKYNNIKHRGRFFQWEKYILRMLFHYPNKTKV